MTVHRMPLPHAAEPPADTEPTRVDSSIERLAMRKALERQHDGPINVGASVPHDYAEPEHVQMRNRRLDCWQEVRRLGHLIVQERRAWNATHSMTHQHEIRRLRINLAFALRNWAAFREAATVALGDLERRQTESSMEQAKALNRLFGGKV